MARSRSTKAQNARPVDFKSAIYIGEDVMPAFPEGSSIEIILPNGNKESYAYPYDPVSTATWVEGMATVIIKDGNQSVEHFQIVDPTNIANNYNQLMGILKDIDAVIESRLTGGGILQTTINNKTLISESLSSLYAIRAAYVKRINAVLAKINKTNPNNPIKSISRFNRGYKF